MERAKRATGRVYAVTGPPLSVFPPTTAETMQTLRGALDAVNAVVYTIDRRFRITTVNEAWDRFALANHGAGTTSETVIGRNILDYISGMQRAELQQICEAIFNGSLPRYERDFDCSSPTEARIYSIVITPLVQQREIVGATFTSYDVTRLRVLTREVAAQQQTLQQSRVALRRREARAALLQRIAEALNSSQSLAATLQIIAEGAVRAVEGQAAVVYLPAADDQQLLPAGSYGVDIAASDGRAFGCDTSAAGQALKLNRKLLIEAARTSSFVFPRLYGGAPHTIVALPIAGPDGIKGVLEVYATTATAFDDDHLSLLTTLTDQSASAIRNAQSLEREQQRNTLLRALNRIGERLASELDEQAIVQYVTRALVAELEMAFARIWLYDEAERVLVLRSSAGLHPEIDGPFARLQLGDRTVGQIAATRTPFMTNNIAVEPGIGDAQWATEMGLRSFVGYPLVARKRLLGVVAFFNRAPLQPELVTALEPLAHQVALALERAQLYVAQTAVRRDAQRMAQVAAQRAAQLSATLASIADGVWTCDQRERLVTVNEAALEMFGARLDDLRLHTIDDLPNLFAESCRDRMQVFGLRQALVGQGVRAELHLQPRALGQVVIAAVTATPIRDSAGEIIGAVAVVRDVTQHKAMERLKDDFLAIAAHELKTPVTAIKGYAQIALTRLRRNADVSRIQGALTTIDEQAERIGRLVEELLDVNRIQAGFLELQVAPFDLIATVRSSIEYAQGKALQHSFTLDAPPALIVTADQARIEQVLQNLFDNAIKYSPDGGQITATVHTIDRTAYVTVRDQGIGIPRDKQPRIFEPWFQAHGNTVGDYGGMGLGLSISREIVERHGGRMWLESIEDQGSLFGFTLPLEPHRA